MPLTSIVSSLVIRLTLIKVWNPGLIFIISARLLLAPLVTSNSERILLTKSSADSWSKSSNCCNNCSIISSNL